MRTCKESTKLTWQELKYYLDLIGIIDIQCTLNNIQIHISSWC